MRTAAPDRLLVDVGNTRVKWARLVRDRLGRQSALVHSGRLSRTTLAPLLASLRPGMPVLMVSVAAPAVTRQLLALLKGAGAGPVHQLRSETRRQSLRNAYRDPRRLGADRWAAMLGAVSEFGLGQPLLVVSAGTAVTIDLIAAGGRHLGGMIVPGANLMLISLLGETAGIARSAGTSKPAALADRVRQTRHSAAPFARDTADGLQNGVAMALVGLVERSQREATHLCKGPPLLVVTGGGARLLVRYLRIAHELDERLVLRGLAAAAS